MQVAHHSLFHFFVFFHLYFIPPFHSTSSYFFLFSSCSMFDLGSMSTLCSCLFDVFIHLSSLFAWGPLGPGLMTFYMHCISCMRGMGVISLGSLSLVSICFVHPITLAYVTSRVLRPPWGYYFALCLTTHTWAILEIDWRLFLGAWRIGSWGDGFTLGHTLFISDGFSEVIWSILGHTLHIDDVFLVRWRFTLRHSQFVSSLGLWWIKSCGMTLH